VRDALAFLTVLPVGARNRPPGKASLLAFPLVGLVVGAIWALAAYGGSWLWGPWPAAAVVVLADLGVTGGLHLDAVADVADGWASRLPAQRAVEVMRDPAVGAVGAATLGAALLARWSFIALLASRHRWGVLAAAPVVGRTAMVVAMATSPRAAGGSLAGPLVAAGLRITVAVAAIALAASVLAAGLRGAGALALGALVAEAGARLARRRFGTVTGDVVGAAGIAAEIVALALLSAR
jgi:adenosylcobinamide-GDP ribazoletransferase